MKETDSIRKVKGVGEKTERLLEKLGITTVGDLLTYYPREYDVFQKPMQIKEWKDQEKGVIFAMITTSVQVKKTGGKTIVSTTVSDETGSCKMVWFHMPYLRNTLKRGMWFVFRGKVTIKNNTYSMEHPEIYTLGVYEQQLHTMQPVYRLTEGISNNQMIKMMHTVLEEQMDLQDCFSEKFQKEKRLEAYEKAIRQIHFPKNQETYIEARKRLVYQEFLLFLLGIQKIKEQTEGEKNRYIVLQKKETEYVMENLPYELTNAQKKVWKDICIDLSGEGLMTRLVQGDVGSGKTILAFLAMILEAENGYQSALMVPTGVLAKQHYEALVELLGKNQLLEKYQPVLLTGANTAKEKRTIYNKIASGTTKMIIGTHALIQEKVEYQNLALVITDEQHRFGVNQRETFSKKGEKPHVLVMSATPIPRTLGIILYGDLDISVIDQLPAQRLPIKNCVVDTNYRPTAYRFIEKQVREGRQAYIICPMVEESPEMDGENVVDYTEKIRSVFPEDIHVEMLHGQMKPDKKNQIMEAFSMGEIQVLVSTTVVEVGVNVPNATVMMVENAERFGLAQLHQLRGRVGRGKYQSYCIFIHGKDQAQKSKRLKILENSNDGFQIAEEDLKLRGPGDLFGIRQSGMLEFKLGDIFQDAEILKNASQAVGEILSCDFLLEQPCHQELKRKLEEYTGKQIQNLAL